MAQTENEIAKPTTLSYRPNAKYKWAIKQGHATIKLTPTQAKELTKIFIVEENLEKLGIETTSLVDVNF